MCHGRTVAQAGAVMALARDFSPRIERHDAASVVLDVSGLGRLLGDAHGIAAELERTASDRGVKARITIAPTQTASRLLALCDDAPAVVVGDVAAALAPLPLGVLEHLRPVGSSANAFGSAGGHAPLGDPQCGGVRCIAARRGLVTIRPAGSGIAASRVWDRSAPADS